MCSGQIFAILAMFSLVSSVGSQSSSILPSYLKKFGNTICGRHPIGVFLNMVSEVGGKLPISLDKRSLMEWQHHLLEQTTGTTFTTDHPYAGESHSFQRLPNGSQVPQLRPVQPGQHQLIFFQQLFCLQVKNQRDSSVSYAAATFVMHWAVSRQNPSFLCPKNPKITDLINSPKKIQNIFQTEQKKSCINLLNLCTSTIRLIRIM